MGGIGTFLRRLVRTSPGKGRDRRSVDAARFAAEHGAEVIPRWQLPCRSAGRLQEAPLLRWL